MLAQLGGRSSWSDTWPPPFFTFVDVHRRSKECCLSGQARPKDQSLSAWDVLDLLYPQRLPSVKPQKCMAGTYLTSPPDAADDSSALDVTDFREPSPPASSIKGRLTSPLPETLIHRKHWSNHKRARLCDKDLRGCHHQSYQYSFGLAGVRRSQTKSCRSYRFGFGWILLAMEPHHAHQRSTHTSSSNRLDLPSILGIATTYHFRRLSTGGVDVSQSATRPVGQ